MSVTPCSAPLNSEPSPVLSRWPIRNKLLVGIALLLVIVVTLSVSGFRGVYAYRGLVKSLRARADELPLATTLSQAGKRHANHRRRSTRRSLGRRPARHSPWEKFARRAVSSSLRAVRSKRCDDYREQLLADEADDRIGDIRKEEEVAAQIQQSLDRIAMLVDSSRWAIDEVKHERD